MNESKFERVRTLVAVGIALLVAFVLILFVSKSPVETLVNFALGPLLSWRYVGNVIELAIPLTFTGLCTAILFQAGLFNLGAEGSFYIAGLAATAVALYCPLGPVALPIAGLLAGLLAGMAGMVLPGIMKAKWNANELVTSLMFNSIFAGLGLYILNYKLRDPATSDITSYEFPAAARLSLLIPGTRVHWGLLVALAAVAFVYVFLYRGRAGYSIRMLGLNRRFTEYAGIDAVGTIMAAHLMAGAIAGLGGSVEVLGMYNRFRWATPTGLGLDGALVAMLAKNRPGAVVGAAVFLAYIRIGADIMARRSDVPAEMVAIIQAVIILLISAERFLAVWRQRRLLKEVAA
jgi:general nucleoside transport system permease protein